MNNEGKCDCPLLRYAAEMERLAEVGVTWEQDNYAVRHRIGAIIVGTVRAERGCAGPGIHGVCPYYYAEMHSALTVDPNVPLLKRKIDAPETGQIL